MKEMNIILTMDCEPTTKTTHANASGPVDWAHGERAIRGYFNIGKSYGFPITYFLHPETAAGQADTLKELSQAGACLGLHLHPWKYSMGLKTTRTDKNAWITEYGGLSVADQRAILAETSTVWETAIGKRPEYFRPGAFSASDTMFKTLVALGFRGGSCSVPGRVSTDVRAIWTAAEPDPHRADAEFRQVCGDLEFGNVPLSVDFSVLLTGPTGRKMHPDLRPDTDWPGKYGISWKTIATNILTQVEQRAPSIPVIVIVTHNHYEYSDANDAVTQRLKASLDAVCAACSAANVKPVGTTIAHVVDRILSSPPIPKQFELPKWAH